jgi:hypothetical protein
MDLEGPYVARKQAARDRATSVADVLLEIEAEIQAGTPENVVRTVTENSRTLKFTTHGFEEE